MNETVEEVMRLAAVMATARVRRFAQHQVNYRGNETAQQCDANVERTTAELQAAVEALCPE